MSTINYEVFNTLKTRMKDKFPKLIEHFLSDSKKYLATISMGMSESHLDQVINAAHSLKSGSGLLGLSEVSMLSESLEYKSKDLHETKQGSMNELEHLSRQIQTAFSAVEGDLRAELDRAKIMKI